jgi:hypothetical protein
LKAAGLTVESTVTDEDSSARNIIAAIFPECKRFLDRAHILKNVKKKVRESGFMRLLY